MKHHGQHIVLTETEFAEAEHYSPLMTNHTKLRVYAVCVLGKSIDEVADQENVGRERVYNACVAFWSRYKMKLVAKGR